MSSSNTSLKVEELEVSSEDSAEVAPLSRFEKMIQTGIWTSRLNKRLNVQLHKLVSTFKNFEEKLGHIKSLAASDQQRHLIQNLEAELNDTFHEVLPEVVEISVVAADNLFALDSAVNEQKQHTQDARDRVALLEKKLAKTFFERLVDLGVYLYKGKKRVMELKDLRSTDHHYAVPGYYDVNNADSGFSVFNNWVSVFNHNGRRYGSSKPILNDALENYIQFHQHYSVKDKTVLELGPFEGANTKQLIDLGAKKVVAMEANPEAFLKCLVVKNELGLDNAQIVYGDFNVLLGADRKMDLPQFDCCVASGVLYHMEDPLYTIDLITASAPVAYVWSQVASEKRPKGDWLTIEDTEGRQYKARQNFYDELKHWGGVGRTSLWLTPESIQQAFIDRGFNIVFYEEGEGVGGKFVSFMARK